MTDLDEAAGVRTPSVTRSLSRRQSILMHDFRPGSPRESLGGDRGGATSKLTLVRAPSLKKAASPENLEPARRRTKSSSLMSPFVLPASSPISSSTSGPVNLSTKPFARNSGPADFGSAGPLTPSTSSGMKAGFLFESGSSGGYSSPSGSNPTNIHQNHHTLTPDQVLELAEGLKSPVLAAQEHDGLPARSLSSLSRNNSFTRGRRLGSDSGLSSKVNTRAEEPVELEPVEYVEMNDDVLLPYVNRPEEVAELISQPNNQELFDLIRPTFPAESSVGSEAPDAWLFVDPEDWTWSEFINHLNLTRAQCDDYEWIRKARRAVRARSEAMWERIGLCLGCDGDWLVPEDDMAAITSSALSDVFDGSTTAGSPVMSMHMDDTFMQSHVWVEGLEPCDPEKLKMDRRARAAADNSDDSLSPGPGASAALMEVVEEEEVESPISKLTPAQIASGLGGLSDPFNETTHTGSKPRAKSFVGLQISTPVSLPTLPQIYSPQYAVCLPGGLERGPGHPLFPSSFSTLSLAPTLPNNNPALKASLSFSRAEQDGHTGHGHVHRAALQEMMGMVRRKSRGGFSESAITFTSEDDI